MADKSDETFVAPAQFIPRHCKRPSHWLSQDGDVDSSRHKVAKLRPLPLPAWLALAAFPEPPGTPFALRRAIYREERKKKYPACGPVGLAIAMSQGTGEATD